MCKRVCVREREREIDRERERESVCVCVCVCVRERQTDTETENSALKSRLYKCFPYFPASAQEDNHHGFSEIDFVFAIVQNGKF